jgi:predicted MFS family arabinose efflux permease
MLAGLLLAVSLRASHELVGAGVLPALVHDLGGERWAGAFFAVYGLAAAAGIVAFGRASDRWSPARALGAALAVFATGMVATGLAPSMPAVVAARAIEGFGGGGLGVVVSAVVMRSHDDAARPRVLAWLSAAWVVPGLLAPGIAVGVAEAFGWRAVFLGLAPGVALAAALVLPGMRAPAPGGGAPAARASASRLRLATEPALAGALAVRGLLVFAFFGVESFLPLALAELRAARPVEVAAVLTLSALGWTAGAFAHARACTRWRAPLLARVGALSLLAGIALALTALFDATPIPVVLAGWALAGLGMGFAYQTATDSAMRAARPGAEGATGAALGLTDALAAGLSTAIGGALLAAAPLARGSPPVFLLVAFAVAAAMGAASLVPARRLAPARPQPAPG